MNSLQEYDDLIRARHGVERVGGVDEAGRGALAGPVVAAVVVFGACPRLEGVNDSKQMTPQERERRVPEILAACEDFGIGLASPAEIGEINILQATHLAVSRALEMLTVAPGHLVTDFLKLCNPPCGLTAITRGDSTSLAVAAASVLAKVARDRIMLLLDAEYPEYRFAKHKGYGTEEHLALLEAHGPSTVHRLTFRGVCWFGGPSLVRCASRRAGCLPRCPSGMDAGLLLGQDWRSHPAHAFIPDSEFRTERRAAKIKRA